MNEEIYVSVDTGKSITKYTWMMRSKNHQNHGFDSFKTNVLETCNCDIAESGRLVKFEGHDYMVGGNEEYFLDNDNMKLSKKHGLCIYTAIAESLMNLNIDLDQIYLIDLSINVPLTDFKNKEVKQKYENKYLSKYITLRMNGQFINFKINKVRCVYEGQGAIIRNTHTTKGYYYVLDIGGKNDTHILFENFKPVMNKNSMTNNGVLECLQSVASDLSTTHQFEIKDVERILLKLLEEFKKENKGEGNKFHYPPIPTFKEIFEKHARDLVKRIRNQVQKFKLNPHFVTLIFSGGGSVILEDFLKDEFNEFEFIFAADARFDNCKGALEKVI